MDLCRCLRRVPLAKRDVPSIMRLVALVPESIGTTVAEASDDTRTSYPYMSANQWWGLRNRFKKSVPSGAITLDWIMSTLDTTQKGAGNVLPQLRLLGLTDSMNKPTDLVYDLKDDETYAAATQAILETAYPKALIEAYDDSTVDPAKVSGWFGRYAKTGERAAISQAKLYLLILSGGLPDPDEVVAKSRAPRTIVKKPEAATNTIEHSTGKVKPNGTAVTPPNDSPANSTTTNGGPMLHVDLQIHISADAGDAQIDAIFKSMAKHLYGK
jgi:hypothetical protein